MEPDNDFLQELKTLRKGRGVTAPGLNDHLGPHLRELSGITDGDSPGARRAKVIATLDQLAAALPDDLSLAVRAALGLHQDARQPFLADRVQWLAEQIDRDVRTARRRVDQGLASMAEQAAVPPPAELPAVGDQDDNRWFIREFKAVVLLDGPAPEAIDQRTVVSQVDGLERVDALITIPRDATSRGGANNLEVEVLYGATIESRERVTSSRFRYQLRLPRTLSAGDVHEYALRFRLPPDQPMRPHYVYTTLRRCDRFDLRVRFDRDRVPEGVWRVSEAYPRDLDDGVAGWEPVAVDSSAEVHVTFTQLKLGLGYGALWTDIPDYDIQL